MAIGILLQVFSSLAFALATVFGKMVTDRAAVSSIEVTLFRFVLGSAVMGGYVLAARKPVRPARPDLVVWRALLNFASVVLLFLGAQYSTVTKANMLQMTFPAFVFLIAPRINRERTRLGQYVSLALTLVGIWLIVSPDLRQFNPADLIGLASGVTAAFAVAILRESSKFDPSYMILFYLMGMGLAANTLLVAPFFVLPGWGLLVPLLLSALAGFLGQVATTVGFRYVDARTGALASASRIVFAALLGAMLFSEPITLRIALGGGLILVALAGTSVRVRLPKGETP